LQTSSIRLLAVCGRRRTEAGFQRSFALRRRHWGLSKLSGEEAADFAPLSVSYALKNSAHVPAKEGRDPGSKKRRFWIFCATAPRYVFREKDGFNYDEVNAGLQCRRG